MKRSRSVLNLLKPHTNCFTKGSGLFGALGHGSFRDNLSFKAVDAPPGMESMRFKRVSAGAAHSAVVTENGDLVLFGRPYDFQSMLRLNRIRKVSKSLARLVAGAAFKADQNTGIFPSPVAFISNGSIVDVSCSAGFTVALAGDGRVYAVGSNRWGQCALDSSQTMAMQPVRVPMECKITAIDTGLQHAIAVCEEGRVYTWGKGNRGKLGDGDNNDQVNIPRRVGAIKDIVAVGAGFGHSVAIGHDGAIYLWGRGMSDVKKESKY